MQKTILFILSMIMFCIHSNAQKYRVYFDTEDAFPDSIHVKNLNTGDSLVVGYHDTIRLINTAGVNIIRPSDNIMVYPNPSGGDVNIRFYMPAAGHAMISVFRITGALVYQQQIHEQPGTLSYRITGLQDGAYTLRIAGDDYEYLQPVIVNGNARSSGIALVHTGHVPGAVIREKAPAPSRLKSTLSQYTMEYNEGDTMEYLAYGNDTTDYAKGIAISDTTISFSFFSCPSSVTDIDSNTYRVTKIGLQCWMAENLKTTRFANGEVVYGYDYYGDGDSAKRYRYYWFYDYDSAAYAETYGALYPWSSIMHEYPSSNLNPSFVQGICPDGWHLPSYAEWEELADYISEDNGGYTKSEGILGECWDGIGKHLKATYSWNKRNGIDDYGFTGIAAGIYTSGLEFKYKGSDAYFWTATAVNRLKAYPMILSASDIALYSYDFIGKNRACSVRCIHDEY